MNAPLRYRVFVVLHERIELTSRLISVCIVESVGFVLGNPYITEAGNPRVRHLSRACEDGRTEGGEKSG